MHCCEHWSCAIGAAWTWIKGVGAAAVRRYSGTCWNKLIWNEEKLFPLTANARDTQSRSKLRSIIWQVDSYFSHCRRIAYIWIIRVASGFDNRWYRYDSKMDHLLAATGLSFVCLLFSSASIIREVSHCLILRFSQSENNRETVLQKASVFVLSYKNNASATSISDYWCLQSSQTKRKRPEITNKISVQKVFNFKIGKIQLKN